MPPCRRCWRTWEGEPLRPDCSPQLELDKPSQINYTMNRKSADRNMASSTFPFKSKRLTAEFVRLGAVNLFCFYRSSREKFSSQHQMPLSQLRRAGSKEQLLPFLPENRHSGARSCPPALQTALFSCCFQHYLQYSIETDNVQSTNPLYQTMAQGVCFAVLFQPECNFTPR